MVIDARQPNPDVVRSVLDVLACGSSDAEAIAAPGSKSLVYADLHRQVAALGESIRGTGVSPGDKVAIVLPNGPGAAVAFLGAACAAIAAPLNPSYRRAEFDFYLEDLDARLLMVPAGYDGPALNSARTYGISVMELHESPDGVAGGFDLPTGVDMAHMDVPAEDDTALVLHTSGTTSRPKIVPLSHRNLAESASNITRSLALSPNDRCLNVMPLFHIHGLIAALLANLRAGGTVICTPGFNALNFFKWLQDETPTWYTAVPTMHQAVLARAPRNRAALRASGLRFIRSSSSSLAPSVLYKLEETFGCLVIEAYGMTEAAHQMAANPLSPELRKPGTVGVESGPHVRIANEGGTFLDIGTEGEVVICGANVTAGYENNPKANAESFFLDDKGDRWFRTGDLGRFDEDGYLQISGRIKEIINRGGEKIAPREIDEVLTEHPAVNQAVAFALTDHLLGEDVAAAVVVADGALVEETDLRVFVGERLASFKVPGKFVFVDEIPKGPTGKLRRIGLAGQLGLE